jgi:hypothetical protein
LRPDAQQHVQIMHHRFTFTGLKPALTLLVYRVPWRQLRRHHPPRGSDAHIAHLAHAMIAL